MRAPLRFGLPALGSGLLRHIEAAHPRPAKSVVALPEWLGPACHHCGRSVRLLQRSGRPEGEAMSKLTIIPSGLVALLVVGGCATRDDIEALRSDIQALRAEIAALRAQIGTTSPAGGGDGQDVKALRSDIAALRAQIGTTSPAGGG